VSAIRNGSWLDEQVFTDPAWVVPGLLPEGCCVLTGHPKIGKSFLVLAIALAAASGGEVLGIPVDQRPVLYLSLEDYDRRIQERARKLMHDAPLPADFYYVTRDYQLTALEDARKWLDTNIDRRPLVIVDTLEKIRNERGSNAYRDDYQAGTNLQKLLAPGGAVIAVHHNRKDETSDDFLDDVSGTLGLTGSVDTIINLKRKRTQKDGTLSVTGRDVEETVYQVIFNDDGKWQAAGTDLADAAQKVTEGCLSQLMRDVLEAVNGEEAIGASDIAYVLETREDTVRQYLSRLCKRGLVVRLSTGMYGPVTESQVSQADDDESCTSSEHKAA
jgi:RecA-family ATPase